MNKKNFIFGIIPARAGSKSVPKKNIYPICNKPLLAYTIESAIKSKCFNAIAVSSDSNEILKISENYSNIISIKRPKGISGDTAKTESALNHACKILNQKYGLIPDYVITLEPTSPFRSKETINKSVNTLINTEADSIIGVVESHYPGYIRNGKFEYFKNVIRKSRRQDREKIFTESSTIYGTKYNILRSKRSVIGDNLYAIEVSKKEAIDINDYWDLSLVEMIIKNKKAIK